MRFAGLVGLSCLGLILPEINRRRVKACVPNDTTIPTFSLSSSLAVYYLEHMYDVPTPLSPLYILHNLAYEKNY
jgi:hypothetical protein